MATDHNFKVKKGLDVLGGDVNLGDGFAYKIDGTTVVDSSRNLTNVNDIAASKITIDDRLIIDGAAFYDNSTNGNNKGFRIGGAGLVPTNGSGTQTDNLVDIGTSSYRFNDLHLSGEMSANTGHTAGKFAVMSTAVHGSYDFYNNGSTYLNGAVIIDDALDLTGSNRALKIAGTTVIDSSRNLTNIGTISSGAITSTGNVKGASLETNHTITFDYNDHFFQAGTGSVYFKDSGGSSLGGITSNGFNTAYNYQVGGAAVIDSSRNLTNIAAAAFGQAVSAMDSTNLDIESAGHVSIRSSSGLFFGITTNNYNSWKGKIWNNNTSTMQINAQALNFNNSGYGSSTFFLSNSTGFDIRTGGLLINQTTVIDSSRNITNVVDITSSGRLTATKDDNVLDLRSATNGSGVNIRFCDNGTNGDGGQKGYLTHNHSDSVSYGSGASFIFSTTEATMTVLADGKLMFKEGLYVKPGSGTGAGTQIIDSSGIWKGGINASSSTSDGFKWTVTDSAAENNFNALHLDYNLSGSNTFSGDKTHVGFRLDVDSSATGGGSAEEHRVYGIYSDTRVSGDSDQVYAIYGLARADNFGTGNYVNNIRGVYGLSQAHQDAGIISANVGNYGNAQNSSSGSGQTTNTYGAYNVAGAYSTSSYNDSNYYGSWNIAQVTSTQTANINSVTGVFAEVQLDNTANALTIDNAYVVQAQYDENDDGDLHTVTNGYLLYGNYAGTQPTNAYGIYIDDDVRNVFKGPVELKDGAVGSPGLTFYNDRDSGLYRVGSNQLGFVTGGGLNLSVDSGGITVFGGSAAWNETTQGSTPGSIHLDPENATNDYGSAITWGASDTSSGTNAHAGIYVRSDGNYGTKMYISTTDSYASGSKTAVKIDHSGHVEIKRGNLYLTPGRMFNIDGGPSTPAYSFNNDSDTGIYRNASNDFGFTTAGTSRFRINNDGLAADSNSNIRGGTDSGIYTYHSSIGGFILKPGGAQYATSTSTVTGACKIEFPSAVYAGNDMISFWVDIYDYRGNTMTSYFIGGYIYQTEGNNEWVNVSAMCIANESNTTTAARTVRFGVQSSKHCVWIGDTDDTWQYPQVVVRDFQAGYAANIDHWADGWGVSFVTTLGTVDDTVSNTAIRIGNEVGDVSVRRDLYLEGNTNRSQLGMKANGATRGYLYANTSNEIGFLDAGGHWGIRHTNDQGTTFFTDNTTESAAIGADLVSGSFGSMVVKDTKSGWAGYSINNRVVFMHDNANTSGIYNDVNNHWMVATKNGGEVELYHNGSLKMQTTSSGIDVTGNVTHDGLTMTSGTDVDQLYTVTDSLTITTSWQNTSINYNDLSTGTYIIQVYVHDHGSGGAHYNEYYSGMMSWYSGTTNSTEFDELALHRAGHAPNDKIIFLRTLRTASNASPNLVLQIRGNYTRTAAANYVFKLRRMI